MMIKQEHWDDVYRRKSSDNVSWYEATPAKSLEFVRATGVQATDAVVDVGAGTSFLVDELLKEGYSDLTVLDVSAEALQQLRRRLGGRGASVSFLQQDVTAFLPTRRYALWHDRAVFHFLVERGDRIRYVDALHRAVLPGGRVIMATFGPAGPAQCSNLPVLRYDPNALTRELGDEFTLVDSCFVFHRTPWAAEQQFLYCRFDHRASPST